MLSRKREGEKRRLEKIAENKEKRKKIRWHIFLNKISGLSVNKPLYMFCPLNTKE